jgi:hypothetical protein
MLGGIERRSPVRICFTLGRSVPHRFEPFGSRAGPRDDFARFAVRCSPGRGHSLASKASEVGAWLQNIASLGYTIAGGCNLNIMSNGSDHLGP